MKASLSEKSNAANKLKQIKDDKDDILLWAKFISSEQKEDFEMLATKNTYIQSAYKTLQVISQDDQKRMEYEGRRCIYVFWNAIYLIWECIYKNKHKEIRNNKKFMKT